MLALGADSRIHPENLLDDDDRAPGRPCRRGEPGREAALVVERSDPDQGHGASSTCGFGPYRLTGCAANRHEEKAPMKVTVDVDCTPEEARRFLGLPDLGAVHEAYVEKLKAAVTDGPSPEMFGDMM